MRQILPFRRRNGKGHLGDERRQKPRICFPIPIKVRGGSVRDERFEFDTVANDLSAGGFSANATRELLPGERLFLLIQFSLAGSRVSQAPIVAAYGIVSRTEKKQNGHCRFAVELKRYRFL